MVRRIFNVLQTYSALEKKYWETRRKLAELPAAAFTVGELHAVNILFSDMNTPGRAPRGGSDWLSGNIIQMENLILSVEAKKACIRLLNIIKTDDVRWFFIVPKLGNCVFPDSLKLG